MQRISGNGFGRGQTILIEERIKQKTTANRRLLHRRQAAVDMRLVVRGITCVLVNPGWVRTDMGGPKALLSPPESVTAMRRLIDTFGPNQSGKFYNYDGREYPW